MRWQREYGTRIMALSDDYLNVTEITYEWEYFAESPAMLKQNGYYFIFGSHLTGWDANDNVRFPTRAPRLYAVLTLCIGLQLRQVTIRPMVRVDRIRTHRIKDLPVPSQLHPTTRQQQRNLHRRPLGLNQPRCQYLRLATPQGRRHKGHT